MILLLRYSVETESGGDVPLQLPVSISYVKAKLDVFNSKTRQGFQKVLERDGICLVTPQTSPPSPKKILCDRVIWEHLRLHKVARCSLVDATACARARENSVTHHHVVLEA